MKKSFVLVNCRDEKSLKKVIFVLEKQNLIILDFWRTKDAYWELKFIHKSIKRKGGEFLNEEGKQNSRKYL